VRETVLAPFDEEWKADARADEVFLEYEGRLHEPVAGTDFAAVHDGYVSVTILLGIVPAPDGDVGAAEWIAKAVNGSSR
jgi:hypothetical protein